MTEETNNLYTAKEVAEFIRTYAGITFQVATTAAVLQ